MDLYMQQGFLEGSNTHNYKLVLWNKSICPCIANKTINKKQCTV